MRARRWWSPAWACCSAAGPTPGRVRADPGRAMVEGRLRLHGGRRRRRARPGSTTPAREPDEDGTLLLSRTVTVEGRSRAHVGGRIGAGVAARRGRRAGGGRARAVRPAAAAAPGRAARPRWTGSPDRSTRSCWTRYREAYTAVACGRRRAGRPAAQRPRAHPGGRPAAARPGRDHPGRSAARRGRGAAGRGAAAGARRGPADRGAASRTRRRRWRARPTDEDAGRDALLGTARRTLEAQSGVDPTLGELAARLEEAATLVGDVAAELSAYLASARRRPGPAAGRSTSGGPRCAR